MKAEALVIHLALAALHGQTALAHVAAHFPLEKEAAAIGEVYDELFEGAGR